MLAEFHSCLWYITSREDFLKPGSETELHVGRQYSREVQAPTACRVYFLQVCCGLVCSCSKTCVAQCAKIYNQWGKQVGVKAICILWPRAVAMEVRGALCWTPFQRTCDKGTLGTLWIHTETMLFPGLPWWVSVKEPPCWCGICRFDHWFGKIPWRRHRPPTLVFLPGKSHGQRDLAGYCPWDHKEVDTTEQLNNNNDMSFPAWLQPEHAGDLSQPLCPMRNLLAFALGTPSADTFSDCSSRKDF